ncbi:MAG: hydrogenobyrinic acid a,c-diamide synthase (glutamine-hydrolyzing) [Candidatus Melainabacteria bacterium RIFOXYA12_FULL_32_12]|nr:MAG: hydrogenobyrinic acid a,c-diamide synthase (glutamine-hydrolyzing) [Candidatus Melainabacteria bacterium RIFOXYA2_FULL_32_9]OGI28093.1 MAG: hydrogenobyrinic acid a,c-diamide synthase (glutamine-hydrolyzing) [Candidatus Melainabacteria bacterium RIFOXYA12_FULL_32_12]
MKAVAISALSSGQGKTMFTMALLHWLKTNIGSVRPYKVGPDYIDPRFHEKITGVDSINLDLYMMTEDEVKSTFLYYAKGVENLVIEGVMGFYDGIDYGTSTYEVTKAVNVPTILVVSAEGSYATIVPTLKGMMEYKPNNTIQGVILNKLSSEKHFQTIKNQIKKELPQLNILGWIQKSLDTISSRHLGLDLTELNNEKLSELSESVMKNIDIPELLKFMEYKNEIEVRADYWLHEVDEIKQTCGNLTLTVVNDEAFSFIYPQNLHFFEKVFGKVHRISALNDEEIPSGTDIVYIPGGYVETPEVAPIVHKATRFKQSLQKFASNPDKKIYAECAGLMFLGEKIQTTDDKWIEGAGILPLNFEIQKIRHRLGYYKAVDKNNLNIYKGHAFHYSRPVPVNEDLSGIKWGLFKERDKKATAGAWTNENKNVLGTYLHSLFFNQPDLVLEYLTPSVLPPRV